MYDSIKNFPQQFTYQPVIENAANLGVYKKFLVAGMGGSNLATGLLAIAEPEFDIMIHRDYALPRGVLNLPNDRLVIASSYSGNTEEVIDAFETARNKKLPLAVISTGGKLISLAKEHSVPYIQLPDTGIQPRSALGFGMLALAKIMHREDVAGELAELSKILESDSTEKDGKNLAENLQGRVPVIYSSQMNFPIAYNWKIKFNETGKIPAWANAFPELNHNEMTGFDRIDATSPLSEKYSFIFLADETDHPKTLQRMEITKKLYEDKGLVVTILELKGSVWQKIFTSLLTADWTAYHTAMNYGAEPEQVPMVEEFKKFIAG